MDGKTASVTGDEPTFLGLAARYIRRHRAFIIQLIAFGLAAGVIYRYFGDVTADRGLTNYLRSGVHGVALALAGWMVQLAFSAGPRSWLGGVLRRLPLAGEVAVKTLAMTAVLTIVAVVFQILLYGWSISRGWWEITLPRILVIAFVLSFLVGTVYEIGRLVGSRALANFILGTYHRPIREERIIMFLDLADSTMLAEQMGEVGVYDLIARFFSDIDEPFAAYRGEIHAYVGDQVIVTWPVGADRERNADSLRCFFEIRRRIARLAADYRQAFGIVPLFRAGLHLGSVVISECGDTKRQLSYFGDAMNVAARLEEHCKTVGEQLVFSGEFLRNIALPGDLQLAALGSAVLRGRRAPVDVYTARLRAEPGGSAASARSRKGIVSGIL